MRTKLIAGAAAAWFVGLCWLWAAWAATGLVFPDMKRMQGEDFTEFMAFNAKLAMDSPPPQSGFSPGAVTNCAVRYDFDNGNTASFDCSNLVYHAADGTELWNSETLGRELSLPLVLARQNILATDESGGMLLIGPDGGQLWSMAGSGRAPEVEYVDNERGLMLLCDDSRLLLVNTVTGEEVLDLSDEGPLTTRNELLADGRIVQMRQLGTNRLRNELRGLVRLPQGTPLVDNGAIVEFGIYSREGRGFVRSRGWQRGSPVTAALTGNGGIAVATQLDGSHRWYVLDMQ